MLGESPCIVYIEVTLNSYQCLERTSFTNSSSYLVSIILVLFELKANVNEVYILMNLNDF